MINVLDEAYVTLTERSDVNERIRMSTCTLLVDICLLLSKYLVGPAYCRNCMLFLVLILHIVDFRASLKVNLLIFFIYKVA